MSILQQMEAYGHEQLVFARDEETGLKTIIAIHNTALGPALGGTRFRDYESEEDALYDVLRLSRGMSLKNAAAGLGFGGGKAVIIGDPKALKSPEFFRAYGRIINSLGGKFYTAEDVNITTADIAHIKSMTDYVSGTAEVGGGPGYLTARGVYMGMKAGAAAKFGSDSLRGLVVSVQGLGAVGYDLCRLLHEEGAKLKVYDINRSAVERAVSELGAVAIPVGEILTTPCDILAPCAMGAVLNTQNASELNCGLVCGGANNILLDEGTAIALEERDILYLPDYIVNAGGVIDCAEEIRAPHYEAAVVTQKVDAIYDTVKKVLNLAEKRGITPCAAADEYALGLIEAADSAQRAISHAS